MSVPKYPTIASVKARIDSIKFDDDTKWLVVSWPEPEHDDTY